MTKEILNLIRVFVAMPYLIGMCYNWPSVYVPMMYVVIVVWAVTIIWEVNMNEKQRKR